MSANGRNALAPLVLMVTVGHKHQLNKQYTKYWGTRIRRTFHDFVHITHLTVRDTKSH